MQVDYDINNDRHYLQINYKEYKFYPKQAVIST